MLHMRMSTVVTLAVFFLLVGTFTSVTIQGAYQVLFAVPLIFYSWRASKLHFRLPPSAWWLLAFTAVALLSIFINWSDIPKPSKNLGKVKYFVMGALGIFPVGVWLKHVSDRTKRRLLRTAALTFLFCGLYCGWQVYTTGVWKAKVLTETMRYTYGTALVIILWAGVYCHRQNFSSWANRKWLLLGFAGLFMSAIFTQSRGAHGSLILALPLVLLFWNKKVGIAAITAGMLLMGFVTWNYFNGDDIRSSVKLLRNKSNQSDQTRRSQWMAAYIAWKERPVFGWGHGNFHSQVKRIKNEYDLPMKQYDDAHAHNVPLEILAGTGIIGLFLFVGWFLTWMKECWHAGGVVRAIMMPFFLAIMFQAQFEVILDANNATWIGFLYAVSIAWNKRYQLVFA